MPDWFSDLRYALRMARRSPLFTIVTVLLLACGIGFNTLIFTALNSLLLKPLPVAHPQNLVRLIYDIPPLGPRSDIWYRVYRAIREHATTVYDVIGQREDNVGFVSNGNSVRVRALSVSDNYFTALGVPPRYGRTFTQADEHSKGDALPLVLSDHFWQRWFHGDPNALGKPVTVGRQRFVVAGIMPRTFHGTSVETSPDLWYPLSALPMVASSPTLESVEHTNLEVAARLRSGVSSAQARDECQSFISAAAEELLAKKKDVKPDELEWELQNRLQLEPLERGVSRLRKQFSQALLFLMGTAGLLLLMVCANVASLLLARSAGRHQEIAIRFAVGASRARVLRQLLTESLLLAAASGIAGLALARFCLPLMAKAVPGVRMIDSSWAPLVLGMDLDLRSFGFALLAAILTTVLFGLAPALHAIQSGLTGSRVSSRWRGRQILVACQAALCTLLVVSSGLLLRSLQNLQTLEVGFDKDHVITFSVDPDVASYNPAQAQSLEQRLTTAVRALPGVQSVGIASRGLMRGIGLKATIAPEGQRITAKDFLNTSTNSVSPEYFDAMSIKLLEGRNLTPSDDPEATPQNIVVNEAFARHFFPDRDPIGQRIGFAHKGIAKGDKLIVGIVNNAKYRSLREPLQPTIYGLFAHERAEANSFILHVKTKVAPESIINPVRQILYQIDPRLPFVEVATLKAEVDASLWSERLIAALASVVGGMAAALAAVGIYGLLAYLVMQRRREIGIRMALGAAPGRIVRWVAAPALRMTVLGSGIGLLAAFLITPLVKQLLYGISPHDIVTFTGSLEAVAVIAAVSAAVPAWRASRISPASALRQQEQ